MRRSGNAQDPMWFKDAIIYELHVRAFHDSNGDGIGDFRGLTQKLDYLQDLGITCIWILPFFPSPLRDDGYDIADYFSVNPDYGTLEDFQEFLREAHARDLQVMIELVVNHTSDQHPWFQRARKAPPGSPERDFYVWSDTDKAYPDVRIIFTDTEKSNWSWDPEANAYYWHRFFSHQPDLNFDNPMVLDEVIRAMNFWLDMGVDALRLDAIPYLVEREGTNCENLPETHTVIKKIRAAMDERYANRMILAEANQWPSDVRAYFGDGDECHMAFHFPLMPRMFMALRLEDRLPITDIIAQTPEIPESCQWGLFLRNHDELTLEMVTDEERDYMYLAYSADPRMRVNIGIRRRLAPLMDHDRRRVELLHGLLFTLPGTPILYYGDEIGMGDNIYLGDRNGVRTPMQWSADRNAGFSRANPARLFAPPIMDTVYGYEVVNVESQHGDSSSLLNWMRNMISLRKLFKVFGRGSIEFLHPANRKVLAYVRRYEDQVILCVANLSRFAQPVELDLSRLAGMRPVEMLGYVEFPAIGTQPYPLTVGPYGMLSFELHPTLESLEGMADDSPGIEFVVSSATDWKSIFEGPGGDLLDNQVLPGLIARQRWFGAKSQRIRSTRVEDWGEVGDGRAAVALVNIQYDAGEPDLYLLALAMSFGEEASGLQEQAPGAIVGPVEGEEGRGLLHDASLSEGACAALLECIDGAHEYPMRYGVLRGLRGAAFDDGSEEKSEDLTPRRSTAEQSNTSIIYGKRFIMKLFRRQQPGPNPDCEVSEFLCTHSEFRAIPPFAGALEYQEQSKGSFTLGMLQGLVPNQGDGWRWTVQELDRFLEEHVRLAFPEVPVWKEMPLAERCREEPHPLAVEHLGLSLESASVLGRRTAEMHLALSGEPDGEAFRPEPLEGDSVRALAEGFSAHAARTLDLLKANLSQLPDEVVEPAGLVLGRRRRLLDRFQSLRESGLKSLQTRIHGDFHLGQVLRVRNDYVILDFEGEPARSLAERRAKHSPLKDVAGMLRSFSYAAQTSLWGHLQRGPDDLEDMLPWAKLWESSVSGEFLRSYVATAAGAPFLPQDEGQMHLLLDAYLLDKAFYELRYELDNRPEWIRIPMAGILALA
jgi:maltose alpha-D-glucosyltransferase / alpha-amylase